MHRNGNKTTILFAVIACCLVLNSAVNMNGELTQSPLRSITIDGRFDDWSELPTYSDPPGNTLHNGVYDVHDTNHRERNSKPGYVEHPDVDITEYKFTHDRNNLYAYFRVAGNIGRTKKHSGQGRGGRYYVIVTIDVDNDDSTGYSLHEGGYYPTGDGYDMNMEIEYYNGAFNTGHYILHGCRNETEYNEIKENNKNGIAIIRPGSYDCYSQWVWFDDLKNGEYPLVSERGSIIFVEDKGPVYQGNIKVELSADGHELEMAAPFRGFMKNPDGTSVISLGKTIDISFSLEASGELAPGGNWASDTGNPIIGYVLK
jgi:hypothetical protein